MRRVLIATVAVIGLLVLVLGGVGWIGSERAIHPPRLVEPERLAAYPFAAVTEDVRFPSRDGTPLAGWFVPAGAAPGPVVVLIHGFGASRADLLDQAAYLHGAGLHVFLFDLRGAGESGGDAVTLGLREPLDIQGAIDYVLTRPEVDPRRVALQAYSLGAAAAVLAMAQDERVAVLVAESPFSDLRGVVAQSFRYFIGLPSFPFAPITVAIVEWRLSGRANDIRPVDAIRRIGARPVFLIEDLDDQAMPPRSGVALYEAAPGPKELWQIAGAGHVGGHARNPAEYQRRVLAFYRAYLGEPVAPSAGR